jgi:hypothetical protein
MAKSRARVHSGIWQLENNDPLQSGTLKKRPKLHSERGLSRICRKIRARLSEKKEPTLQEENQTAQDKSRFSSSSLLMQYHLQLSATHFRPPFLPPLRELDLFRFFPRPPPPFFRPPLSDLFTVAQARRSASLLLTPRFL